MKKNISWVKKQMEDVQKVFAPNVDYDEDNDILYITWLPQQTCKYSLESEDGFVFDMSEQDEIKGVEISDFKKRFMNKKLKCT